MEKHKIRLRSQLGQASLIGLLVVIAIIGILAAMFYPKIAGRSEYSVSGDQAGEPSPLDRADDASCVTYQSQVNDAITMYTTDHNHPPRTLQDLKRYGINDQIINTPNCNFVLPKGNAGAPAPAPTAASNPMMTTVNTGVSSAPGVNTAPPPGVGPPPPPPGGNNILPTKMGRSIPLDGGSANIERQAGDDRGNQ